MLTREDPQRTKFHVKIFSGNSVKLCLKYNLELSFYATVMNVSLYSFNVCAFLISREFKKNNSLKTLKVSFKSLLKVVAPLKA